MADVFLADSRLITLLGFKFTITELQNLEKKRKLFKNFSNKTYLHVTTKWGKKNERKITQKSFKYGMEKVKDDRDEKKEEESAWRIFFKEKKEKAEVEEGARQRYKTTVHDPSSVKKRKRRADNRGTKGQEGNSIAVYARGCIGLFRFPLYKQTQRFTYMNKMNEGGEGRAGLKLVAPRYLFDVTDRDFINFNFVILSDVCEFIKICSCSDNVIKCRKK
ncbi:hypothetical protein Phum_PHUM543100 [Pediculus humanus corporis]|uniref:Uncharacterized protein n=1 Tax=Pediculus humanus subsp. corporis TaxID=121224 RepID=E0W021_PEDHC|nr:uncharacterized protein Phum_PHUM543100 [Pediculus humanus corporis]EEB18976.1 hypothetical protein Phum_PHUM543100 [Pediculus humanus corporis]